MAGNKPSTDIDENKKKTDEGKKEKEIKPEEPRWEVKWHKAFKEQEENFAKTFSDLTKEGVLETLQKKLPDNFKDAKSYDEAMKILKEGNGVERLWHNKDMYDRIDLNVKKEEEKQKQKKEVEKKKEELNEDKKNEEKKSESKEKDKEDDDIEADEKKEKSEKKWFFWAIWSFFKGTSKQAWNLIRYIPRTAWNSWKMFLRSLKYFWFDILNFPSGGEAMKKIWAKYQEDMKKYKATFKWNYKKSGK